MRIMNSFGSMTTKLLAILILAFLFIVVVVATVIETKAKPKVISMTSEAVEETGNDMINSIMSNINEINGLARATSLLTGALPQDEAIYQQTVGNLMTHMDATVVSGGVWFDPNMYEWGVERKSLAWQRDAAGKMVFTNKYDDEAQVENSYYKEWWYTPAVYSKHDQCVWSRAYLKSDNNKPMITCAKAIYGDINQSFKGVMSFDIVLDDLNNMMRDWQQTISGVNGQEGYVFLLDLDNRVLSFPNNELLTKASAIHASESQTTNEQPQDDVITIDTLSKSYDSYKYIAKSVNTINQKLIDKAKATDTERYEWVTGTIHRRTNMNKISREESALLSSLLLLNEGGSTDSLSKSHLVETVAVTNDAILHKNATAFVFVTPFTHWKMVVVKPNDTLVALANQLSKQLIFFMFLGLIPILLLTALAFTKFLTQPLRRMARLVDQVGTLVQQNKYQQLTDHKLPNSNINEIQTISDKTNQLIDRVVENEGALADINTHLENKIVERTQKLQQTMNDLKTSQVQLVQSEKMATIGQMVAGVAHEVNTPLGYVRSNMELIGENLPRYDELVKSVKKLLTRFKDENCSREDLAVSFDETLEYCESIQEDELSEDLSDLVKDSLFGIDQISELVVSLRDFSRIDETKIKDVDINDCIKSALTMSKNNLKAFDIHQDLAELPSIQCNPAQINQVLLNIFNNAAQAISSGQKGKLTITSKEKDDKIVIQVADNGSGMPDNVMKNIFEPFYTTKKAGEGTGLGLAITHKIMEQHHGSISVQSKLDKGTTFTLILPMHQPIIIGSTKKQALFAD